MADNDGNEVTLRILHLSDLHERGEDDEFPGDMERVLGKAFKDNLQEMCAGRQVDLVIFTGDIAYSGQDHQYLKAGKRLKSWLKVLKVPPRRLFLVPGNHDIDCKVSPRIWRSFANAAGALQDPREMEDWLASRNPDRRPPPGFKATWKMKLLLRQEAYRRWLGDLGRTDLDPANSNHGLLGYRVPVKLRNVPFPIQVIGLDSSWLSQRGKANKVHLRMTARQVKALTVDRDGNTLPGLRLGLHHHGLSELADGEECRQICVENLDLRFRGHQHRPQLVRHIEPGRVDMCQATGCLFDSEMLDNYTNGCQLVTLTCDRRGALRRARIWFRSWSGTQGRVAQWVGNNFIYGGANGEMDWFEVPPGPRTLVIRYA